MADTINRIKILDDNIAVNSKVNYGVLIGGQHATSQAFKAISSNASSAVFNIVVPSIETIMSRHILIRSTVILRIDVQNQIANIGTPVNYGVTDSLAPFPFNQLIQNIQCSINNNNITLQQSDMLDVLLRMYNSDDLAMYDTTTPVGLDSLYDYSDGVMLNPYYLGVYNNGTANTVGFFTAGATQGGQAGTYTYTSFNNNMLSYDMNRPASSSHYHKPRGGYVIDAIFKAASDTAALDSSQWSAISAAGGNIYVQFTVTEPLFLSPFLMGLSAKEDHPGFFGINALNFTINFSSNASRAWRSARFVDPAVGGAAPNYQTKTATLINVTNAEMLVKFYTPKATQLDNPRCVVPYHEWQIFKTGQTSAIAPSLQRTAGDARTYGKVDISTLQGITTIPLTSSNIQLQSIPERLIVFVRRIKSNLNCTDSDSYLTIRNIRVNFNNQSGLLATYSPQQLYEATITDGGVKNLTWSEFSGVVLSADTGVMATLTSANGYNAWPRNQYAGLSAGVAGCASGTRLVPTTGTILSLAFGSTIALPEEYYAPGSIGQFSLQVQVDVANLTKDTWSNYELVVMVQNPGVLITDRGSSSTFVGLLTKDSVLQTKDDDNHYTLSYARHMSGGAWYHHAMNGLRWLHNHGITAAKNFLKEHVNHPITNKAVEIADKLGYGVSAGNKLHNRLM